MSSLISIQILHCVRVLDFFQFEVLVNVVSVVNKTKVNFLEGVLAMNFGIFFNLMHFAQTGKS